MGNSPMTAHDVERVAAALLYEGYMLYPYRPSAVKNRRRFNFGVVSPAGGDGPFMQTECLVRGDDTTEVDVRVRFLHLVERTTDGEVWQEAIERDVQIAGPLAAHHHLPFSWSATQVADGHVVRRQRAITGTIELTSTPLSPGLSRVRVRLTNNTATRAKSLDEQLLHSLVSAHTILSVTHGQWISLLDPPKSLNDEAAACVNVRTWPVLAGQPGSHDTMLSSPIIIADYPAIAAESAGDLFDATEIDEILSLRVLTLTDAEQHEMRHADDRARRLLERTQALTADDFMRMHGAMRRPNDAAR
jgi:hypothetical protein